jgi:hypothetical protein
MANRLEAHLGCARRSHRADLHHVRRFRGGGPTRGHAEGSATTVEEMLLGACWVAVPITVDDEVVASIGFVAPDLRRMRARLVSALQVAAQGIALSLGRPA